MLRGRGGPWYNGRRKDEKEMAHYIKSALGAVADGLSAFLLCFRPGREEASPRLESIDRYFVRVGGYLIGARNRFERECMGGGDVRV